MPSFVFLFICTFFTSSGLHYITNLWLLGFSVIHWFTYRNSWNVLKVYSVFGDEIGFILIIQLEKSCRDTRQSLLSSLPSSLSMALGFFSLLTKSRCSAICSFDTAALSENIRFQSFWEFGRDRISLVIHEDGNSSNLSFKVCFICVSGLKLQWNTTCMNLLLSRCMLGNYSSPWDPREEEHG